jgi:ABC-type lipoprotein export system ATPase subunit
MLASLLGKNSVDISPAGRVDTKQAPPTLIRLENLVKTYENAAGEFEVLKDLNVGIDRGEFVAVIGKSGSGKSTLLNMITGIDRPTSGGVYVGETAVHKLTENQMAVWRGRHLGIVFQFFQLLPTLSLVENVMLPMDFCNVYAPGQRRKKAMALLDRVGLADHADKLPSAISGGQQQRVAIARALANDPPIVLADEPTGNLDSRTAESVFNLFEALVDEGKTVVMVTHDTSQAQRVSRTLLLVDGEIINEYVAHALPSLSHRQMLRATRAVEPLHFEPGATIIQEDTPGDRFYIVAQGQVDVVLRRRDGADIVVAHLRAGQYFGEVSLLQGGRTTATVRAAPGTAVDVLALDRPTFESLLSASAATREAVDQTARRRVLETDARRGGA